MVATRQLDVPRTRDRASEVPRVLDVADLVFDGMEDQRGHPDRRRDITHVDVVRHPHEYPGRGGRSGLHLEPGEPLECTRVVTPTPNEDLQRRRHTAPALGQSHHRLLELLPGALSPG